MPKADYFMRGLEQRMCMYYHLAIVESPVVKNALINRLFRCPADEGQPPQQSLRKVVNDSEATSSYALGPVESPRAVQLDVCHCSSATFVLAPALYFLLGLLTLC